MWRVWERCSRVCGFPHNFPLAFSRFFPHPNTLILDFPQPPHSLSHLPYGLLPHISDTYYTPTHFPIPPPHFSTPSTFPPYLTQLLKLPEILQFPHHPYSSKFSILPGFFSILPHTCFITNSIPKFFTLLIYCQI